MLLFLTFAHFRGLKKKLKKCYSELLFWQLFFDEKGRFLQQQKIFIFQVPCDFFETDNFAARARGKICRFLGFWTHKNITNGSQCVHFRKSQKVKIPPPWGCVVCIVYRCQFLRCAHAPYTVNKIFYTSMIAQWNVDIRELHRYQKGDMFYRSSATSVLATYAVS